MALSNFLRGVGRGVASVGRAVQSASQKIDEAVLGQPQAAPTAMAAPGPATPATELPTEGARGWMLPDIGPAPDPNLPEYQDEEGKKRFKTLSDEYAHKQDIHQAYQDLEKVYRELHPARDFEKEYRELVAMQKQHEEERPRGSGLARAALALGDFNPAVQQSGRSGLSEYNQRVEREGQRADTGFAQRLALRMKSHEAAAEQAEAAGNWKKALAEREKAALLKADEDALKHKRDIEKETVKQEAATERAKIRRDAAEKTARIRANAIASGHGLTGSFLATFQKEAAKAVAKFLGPRDILKDYTMTDLDTMTGYLENLAEMFHDQQYGDGSAETFVTTPPSRRVKPKPEKPASKEKF